MAISGSVNTNTYKDRYYTFSWDIASQSVANNTTTINWSVVAAGSTGWRGEKEFEVTINGETVFTKATRVERYGGDTVASGTLDIAHNADGTKTFAVYVGAAVYTYGTHNVSASTTFTLEPIARRATITSAPAFTDEENPTITYSNPMGNSVDSLQVCISVDGYNAAIAYRDVSKTGTSYTFNLTDAERLALQSGYPDATGGWAWFYIRTVIDGVSYTNRMAKWMTIVPAAPDFGDFVYQDTNTTTVAITNDNQRIIANMSNLYYQVTPVAKKGATIASIQCTCGSKTYTGASNTINQAPTGYLKFTVTDSRGNKLTQAITTITTYNYFTPTLNFVKPTISTDGTTTLNVSGKFYSSYLGKNESGTSYKNSITASYRMKETGGEYGEWTDIMCMITPVMNGINQTDTSNYTGSINLAALDYTKSYTFQARVVDKINTILSVEYTVKALPVFDWGEDSFNFNVPVTIEGNLVNDYIVDRYTETAVNSAGSSTNATWYVEKWASGKATCYCSWNMGTMSFSTSMGALYYSGSYYCLNFPSGLFTATPIYCSIEGKSSVNNNAFFVLRGGANTSATSGGNFWVASPYSSSIVATTVCFYAVGTWK